MIQLILFNLRLICLRKQLGGPLIVERGIEDSGRFLELEYLGDISKRQYALSVDKFKHPQEYLVTSEADAERIIARQNKMKMDYSDSFKDESYIKYIPAMNLVEKSQLGDPEKPSAFFAANLRRELADLMGSEYKVKFFTALGTHLDTQHATDAFFKLYNLAGKELSVATIDITGRPKTNDKVGLVIEVSQEQRDSYDFDSDNFDKDEFFRRIKDESLKIKEVFLKNINKKKEVNEETFRVHQKDRPKRPRIARSQ